MAKHKGLKVYSYVGHYRLQEAVNAMEDGVTAHRDVKAVFAHNDTTGGNLVTHQKPG
jgi:ribose transport system substrate-binding protein